MADGQSAGAHDAHPATRSHALPRLKRPDLADFWSAFAGGTLLWTAAAALVLS